MHQEEAIANPDEWADPSHETQQNDYLNSLRMVIGRAHVYMPAMK